MIIFTCERVDTVIIDSIYNKGIGEKLCYSIVLSHEDNTHVLGFSHFSETWAVYHCFQAMCFDLKYIHISVNHFTIVLLCLSNAQCLVWRQYVVWQVCYF